MHKPLWAPRTWSALPNCLGCKTKLSMLCVVGKKEFARVKMKTPLVPYCAREGVGIV